MLEYILLDPITAKRIAKVCGCVEELLTNPRKVEDKLQEPKLMWTGTISELEAQTIFEQLLIWADNDEIRLAARWTDGY